MTGSLNSSRQREQDNSLVKSSACRSHEVFDELARIGLTACSFREMSEEVDGFLLLEVDIVLERANTEATIRSREESTRENDCLK